MRTTLTLDDDVAVLIERLKSERRWTLKQIVNQALREGLRKMDEPVPPQPFRTKTASLGRCLVGNIDNIAEVLAIAEGEGYR
jgi:hypothetical protein